MAVVFNTLLNRLGRIFQFAKDVRTFQGTTMQTEFETVMAQYSDSTRDMVQSLTSRLELRKREAGSVVQDLAADANKTLIDMMDDDQGLERLTATRAIDELIRQLKAGSQTIDRPSAGYVTLPTSNKGTASGSNTGNGILLLSDMAPQGYLSTTEAFDYPSIRTERILARCIADSTSRSVQEGSEVFSVIGERAVDRMSYEWPKGSGTNGTITAASPTIDGGRSAGVNICTNSDFEDFTSNAPDRWTIVAGSAGTHIDDSTSAYSGTNCLEFTGDGSTNPNIKQTLNTTTGTRGRINPDRPYSITAAIKYATAAPTASIIISVRNSSGTILHDSIVGRAMQLTVTSGSIGTSYAIFSAVVFSPINVPKGSYVDIRFSTNVANTSQVFVDSLVIAEMPRIKRGGLAYQIIPGSTNYTVRDEFTAAITNNIGSGDGELALEFDRFFNTEESGLVLPSATSPTLADGTFIT
jgi:hypothetical protein|tara:strand:+ start:454 stop:1857 length:1404 start_codon:yes stop_codon:yes gene_type:complete